MIVKFYAIESVRFKINRGVGAYVCITKFVSCFDPTKARISRFGERSEK